jgi:hypothetical protein
VAEDGAYGITFIFFDDPLGEAAGAGTYHGHGGFVGFHFQHFLVVLHEFTGGHQEAHDGGLGDGFAQLRHQNGYVWHKTNAGSINGFAGS